VAQDVTPVEAEGALVEQADDASIEAETAKPINVPLPRSERARKSAYRFRFVLFYFALAIAAGSALGAFVVVLQRPKTKPPAPWSTFVPKGSLTARLFQIADVIPKGYRLANGKQLVGATPSPPQQQITPDQGQSFITLPLSRTEVHDRGNITTSNLSSSIQFVLCGGGSGCELVSGTPSQARYLLLEREALEISLYALKYVNDLDSVTVLFPPSHTVGGSSGNGASNQPRQTALFLRRTDVVRLLSRPYAETLASKVPGIGTMSTKDMQAVRTIAVSHTFDWSVTQAQDGAFIRVLEPSTG
jgi:hypothetical protein